MTDPKRSPNWLTFDASSASNSSQRAEPTSVVGSATPPSYAPIHAAHGPIGYPSTTVHSYGISLTGKNIVIAYLLWFFLGSFSIHRFYLGRPVSGLIQLMLGLLGIVLTLTLLGAIIGIPMLIAWFIWWVLDAYFVYVYVERFNGATGVQTSRLHFTHTRG